MLRMAQIAPQRRPHYRPTERMAILQLVSVRKRAIPRFGTFLKGAGMGRRSASLSSYCPKAGWMWRECGQDVLSKHGRSDTVCAAEVDSV